MNLNIRKKRKTSFEDLPRPRQQAYSSFSFYSYLVFCFLSPLPGRDSVSSKKGIFIHTILHVEFPLFIGGVYILQKGERDER